MVLFNHVYLPALGLAAVEEQLVEILLGLISAILAELRDLLGRVLGNGQLIQDAACALLDCGVVDHTAEVGQFDQKLNVLFVEREDDRGQRELTVQLRRVDHIVTVAVIVLGLATPTIPSTTLVRARVASTGRVHSPVQIAAAAAARIHVVVVAAGGDALVVLHDSGHDERLVLDLVVAEHLVVLGHLDALVADDQVDLVRLRVHLGLGEDLAPQRPDRVVEVRAELQVVGRLPVLHLDAHDQLQRAALARAVQRRLQALARVARVVLVQVLAQHDHDAENARDLAIRRDHVVVVLLRVLVWLYIKTAEIKIKYQNSINQNNINV